MVKLVNPNWKQAFWFTIASYVMYLFSIRNVREPEWTLLTESSMRFEYVIRFELFIIGSVYTIHTIPLHVRDRD